MLVLPALFAAIAFVLGHVQLLKLNLEAKTLTIFVAGQIGTVPSTGKLVSDDIAEQARQALDNTATILEAAGSSLSKVVSSSLFLTEFDKLSRVNAVYSKYFPQDGPAKFACGVTTLYDGAKFEIQVIALA